MKILIVEDDENKRIQLSNYLDEVVPDAFLLIERSLQSGVRRIRREQFDLVILDMTLPTFDPSSDEPGDDTVIFGGKDFLSQMDRFDIIAPVIVFTQFEVFGRGLNEVDLKDLDQELKKGFPEIYHSVVYYHASIDSWKTSLKAALVGTNCIRANND
ncbi:hypothetical protein ACUN9V_05940 [Salinicola sp. V024]|uniref:hypothetical protein n=1 Tax=Salinicola sp. V024 TaxID=3459609 RepID=UPI004043F701